MPQGPLAIAQVTPFAWETPHEVNEYIKRTAAELRTRGDALVVAAVGDLDFPEEGVAVVDVVDADARRIRHVQAPLPRRGRAQDRPAGQDGQPANGPVEEAAEVLRNAIDADQVLLDGSWTAMPFTGVGSQARERAKTIAGEAGVGTPPDPASFETRRAFVAWDLVELDGASLHDIPYQERRRLLSSVIIESVRVRVSPAMRPPIRGWLEALRADGFTHYLAKHANSRYLPGETAPDWLKLSVLSDAQPTILERLFGQSQRRVPKLPPRQR